MKKISIFILTTVLFIALVTAAVIQEPWSADVDAGNYDINNVNNITANNFIGSFIGDVDSMNWTKLENYPVACPDSGAITTLDDSITCSDLWVDVAGDIMTGNLTINGTGVLRLKTNTTTRICNEVNAGAIYYNNDTNKHQGCNVTGWQDLY